MPAMTCEHDHALHIVGASNLTLTSGDSDDVRTKTTHRAQHAGRDVLIPYVGYLFISLRFPSFPFALRRCLAGLALTLITADNSYDSS